MADTRILYLECFSGISGDMLLGALLDCGASETVVREGLAKLSIATEFELDIQRVSRSGTDGTSAQVEVKNSHHQGHRSYTEICEMIMTSGLSENIIRRALGVFRVIGEAEAAVHEVALTDVHFHEIGAIDSIVDIVGCVLALESLNIGRIVCSTLYDGSGTIRCSHGEIPVPVPAVVAMLEGTNIPFQSGMGHTEMVTPTGLGLVKALCDDFEDMPKLSIINEGFGFGQRDTGRLNALRLMIGIESPVKHRELCARRKIK